MTQDHRLIAGFLSGNAFAVVGASRDRSKFGNKVLRCYLQNGRTVYPVNPKADEIEGLTAFPDLGSIDRAIHGVSIVTPPAITEQVVEEAGQLSIEYLWLQPGAESETAIRRATHWGMHVIAGGPCLLVELGFRES